VFFDYAISAYLVVAVLVAGVIVFAVLTEGGAHRRVHRKRRELVTLLLFVLGMGLLTFVFGGDRYKLLERLRLRHPHSQTTHTGTGSTKKKPGSEPPGARSPEFRWIPAVAVGSSILAGAAVYVVSRRRRRRGETDEDVAAALARALDDALGDLRSEQDPRRAVIAAYARMERLLATYGIPRRPSETPFEYLSRVLIDLHAGATPVFELTALFERAKFSHHAIEPELKDEAIDALAAVRDELRKAA
jgi:hypothetical protein